MVKNKLRKEIPQSVIGLNLDPNNSSKLIQEFDIINMKISSEELKNFETCIPELTIRPLAEKFPYERNTVYNFIISILKPTRLEKPRKYASFQQLINQVCTVSTTMYCL